MTLIYDPIEALQRIEKLVDESLWRLDSPDFTEDEVLVSLPSILADLGEASQICDTVLFMKGLKS